MYRGTDTAMRSADHFAISRRGVLAAGAASTAIGVLPMEANAVPVQPGKPAMMPISLTVNGDRHDLTLDTRTTLLDTLREHLKLTGTKKGCDHGQCGACTVIAGGRRMNACLSLAVMHEGA